MTNVMPTPSTAQTAMFWEISEKLLVEKNLACGDAEERDDHHKDAEDPDRLHAGYPLDQRLLGFICNVDGRIVWGSDNAHASSSLLKSKAPVMAPTNCSTVVPSEGSVTTRVPSRMT